MQYRNGISDITVIDCSYKQPRNYIVLFILNLTILLAFAR